MKADCRLAKRMYIPSRSNRHFCSVPDILSVVSKSIESITKSSCSVSCSTPARHFAGLL
nr:MAG TPA: hypothetical protein [Caudoviricetes sp.]